MPAVHSKRHRYTKWGICGLNIGISHLFPWALGRLCRRRCAVLLETVLLSEGLMNVKLDVELEDNLKGN